MIFVGLLLFVLWARFLWPCICVVVIASITGKGQLIAPLFSNQLKKNSIIEKVIIYSQVGLGVITLLLPGLFMLWLFDILLLLIQVMEAAVVGFMTNSLPYSWIIPGKPRTGGSIFNSHNGVSLFNRGDQHYGNQPYGMPMQNNMNSAGMLSSTLQFGNRGFIQNRINEQFNSISTGTPSFNMPQGKQPSGVLNGVPQVKVNTFSYISENGTLTIVLDKKNKKLASYKGIPVMQSGDSIAFAYQNMKVATDTGELWLHIVAGGKAHYYDVKLSTCGSLKGIYFVITNRGVRIDNLFSGMTAYQIGKQDYQKLYVSDNSVILECMNGVSGASHAFYSCSINEDSYSYLNSYTDKDYKMRLPASKVVEHNAKDYYEFDKQTMQLRELLEDVIDLNGAEIMKYQPKESNFLEDTKSYEVEKGKGVVVTEAGQLVYENPVNGKLSKIQGVKEETIGDTDVYSFDTAGTAVVDLMQEQPVVDGETSKYKVSNKGQLVSYSKVSINNVSNLDEYEAKLDEEENIFHVKDVKKKFRNVVNSCSTLKTSAEKKMQLLRNKSWKEDGVYNDGSTDLMCAYGELMPYIMKEDKPWLLGFVSTRLRSKMDFATIIDKIGDGWYEDITVNDVCDTFVNTTNNQATSDAESVFTCNAWVVNDQTEQAAYISYAIDASMYELNYSNTLREYLLSALTTTLDVTSSSQVCLRIVVSLSEDKSKNTFDGSEQSFFNVNLVNADIHLLREVAPIGKGVVKDIKESFVKYGINFAQCYSLDLDYGDEHMIVSTFSAETNVLASVASSKKIVAIDDFNKDIPVDDVTVYKYLKWLNDKVLSNKRYCENLFIIAIQTKSRGYEYKFCKRLDSSPMQELGRSNSVIPSMMFWTADGHNIALEDYNFVIYVLKELKE